jgi:peptidylprolyl isomerase
MHSNPKLALILSLGVFLNGAAARAVAAAPATPTMAELLAGSSERDWRPLDPEQTLYLELATGRVVIELAPQFAPLHVANIKTLVHAGYFNGLAIVRVQDNYVVQWADPNEKEPRPVPPDVHNVAAEFDSPTRTQTPFTRLADGDVYAPMVGFSDGFPVARDPKLKLTWLVHCYGMVGVGRDNDPESNGTELYAVIGHSPRHLDRNVALVGRVVKGMELLSSLPRGSGEIGFYAKNETPVPIRAITLASDLPPGERAHLEIIRTDARLFTQLIEARRNRPEAWFLHKAAHIEVCNVPIPVREQTADAVQAPR